MNEDELHVRVPQDVIKNEDGSVTIRLRRRFDQRFNTISAELVIPAGYKDLYREIELAISIYKQALS